MNRNLVSQLHRVAGLTGFTTIFLFWTSTVLVELLADHAAVAGVKAAILWGMIVLVPAMATVGATGLRLGGKSNAPVIAAKRRRMPLIALNGLLVLLPSAVFLASRAAAGQFDGPFYVVQAIELVAGAANLTLMGLSIRDGLSMTRKRRQRVAPRPA